MSFSIAAGEVEAVVKRLAKFVWLMCRIAWCSIRHPFTTTVIELDDRRIGDVPTDAYAIGQNDDGL